MTVGVVGIVTSTVMACKATLKAEDVIEEAEEKIKKIHQAREIASAAVAEGEEIGVVKYTEEDYKKDMTIVYVQTGWNFTKLYAPAVTIGIAGIACILGAHGIMKKRNLALVAAYKAIEESFSSYRKRVVKELGMEKDREFRYGTTKVDVTKLAYTEENGVVHPEESTTVEVIDTTNQPSQYARFFDESSSQWSKTPEYNLTYI
jgi:hypothetical protein